MWNQISTLFSFPLLCFPFNVEILTEGKRNSIVHKNIFRLRLKGFFYNFSYLKFLKLVDVHTGHIKTIFNDPDIKKQWYFVQTEKIKNHHSHELNKVWIYGINGKGVVVGILGEGVDIEHKDLIQNYARNLSYNFINYTSKISISYNGNPTRYAGLISAVADNNLCGVGAAPYSKFASLQILDNYTKIIEDSRLAQALIHRNNEIYIYIITWMLYFKSEINKYPGFKTILSLKKGFKYGRNGLGSIFISGSGDHKIINNNCAFNGILQRPEVLVFGAISYNGDVPSYLESCTAILASSLSSNELNRKDNLYSTDSNNICKNSSNGSFSSASISSGIIALLISFNPKLSVRQILNLIIWTSDQFDTDVIINSAGYMYSYNYGFGQLNALDLVRSSTSEEIMNLREEKICSTEMMNLTQKMLKHKPFILHVYTSGCLNTIFCVTFIEQVYIIVSIKTSKRNSVNMFLESPTGTRFKIIEPRRFDNSTDGFKNYRIKIMGYYGENPIGAWKIEIISRNTIIKVENIRMHFHGTCINPSLNSIVNKKVLNYLILSDLKLKNRLFIDRCKSIYDKVNVTTLFDLCSCTSIQFSILFNVNQLL